ncbi:lipoprotein [Streptomyces kunmingensis]
MTAAIAGAALMAVAGCGGSGGGDDKPFADKSADEIAADAVKATQEADSMHMKGTVRQSAGSTVTVDLSVDQRKNCAGTIRTGGTSADVRHTDATLYLRGDEKYWRHALKGQPGGAKVVPKVADKWVKAPADDSMTQGLCDKQGLVASMDENKSERRGMKKGSTTKVDGAEAIRLTKKTAGGETLTLYVATEGKPYILRTTSSGGEDPNTATFSDYDKPVRPQAPEAGETVDLKELAASAQKA